MQTKSINLGLRNSNFKIGTSNGVDYTSETKDKFIKLETSKSNLQKNEEMAKNLKGHHFTLAEHTKLGE